MESQDELKETDIKDCTCYHFDDVIRDSDINFDIYIFLNIFLFFI